MSAAPAGKPRRRRLVYRVYGFVAVLAIAIMAALIFLPRYTRAPRYLRPHAALIQYLIERVSLRSGADRDTIIARIESRILGKLSLFDATGHLLRSNIDPPLDPPSAAEQRALHKDKWSLDVDRIVVRSDDGSMLAVYSPDRGGFPFSYVTPLARIRVALELAAEDPIAATDVLADVGADLDEIDQLINDILTTSRLDSEYVSIDREATSVSELVDRAARRFTTRHPGRTLERPPDDPPGDDRPIRCDPVLLRRALDNLLDNAAKYSDPGTPVTLAVQPNGTSIAFEIVDRGIGMSPAELDCAFTPFWRADGSRTRRTGGVGLGLALARRIARAHGGDVTLASHPGQGTTARLEVPLM